jgi:Flp pilus assembly protein TadG
MKYLIALNEQTSILSPKHFRYRGIAFAWTALIIFFLFWLFAFTFYRAKLWFNIHELQNAADSAALAGAQIVKVKTADETRERAHDLAYANKAEKLEVTLRTTAQAEPFESEANLDIILGRWINSQRYFFETLDTPDAVKAIARRSEGLVDAPALSILFGPFIGADTINARRDAIGWYAELSGAGLIVLDPYEEIGLHVFGTAGVQVEGGSIHVNSTAVGTQRNAAVYVQGNAKMLCGRLTLQGHTFPAPPTEDDLNGWDDIWWDDTDPNVAPMEKPYDIWEGAPYMPDPLGPEGLNIQPPVWSEYLQLSYDESTDGSTTLYEGYYPDGIEINQTGTYVTLSPGTYIIGGGNGNKDSGLIVNGGNLRGLGVLIYLTKDYIHENGRWAQLDLGGNEIVYITPPGDETDPKIIDGKPGVSIWQDRENTANEANLRGGAGMEISGTLYFPNNHVDLAGTPGKAGNQIICWTLSVGGTAPIMVIYDGRNNLHRGTSVLVK